MTSYEDSLPLGSNKAERELIEKTIKESLENDCFVKFGDELWTHGKYFWVFAFDKHGDVGNMPGEVKRALEEAYRSAIRDLQQKRDDIAEKRAVTRIGTSVDPMSLKDKVYMFSNGQPFSDTCLHLVLEWHQEELPRHFSGRSE